MIYGPYEKRKRRIQSVRLSHPTRPCNYTARPRKAVAFLRLALALCIAALLGLGGRMLYLEHAARTARSVSAPYVPTAWELLLMAALSISALLLLYLLERNGRRK